jgi:hypothetical protein
MTARPMLMIRPLVFRTIILLIGCNASAGIAAIVAGGSGQVGNTEAKVIYTTLLATGGAALVLPCFLAHEARRPRPLTVLPAFAVGTLLLGFGLCIAAVWTQHSNTFDNSTVSLALVGAAMAHLCLISLAQLRTRLIVLQLFAVVTTSILAGLIVKAVWAGNVSDLYWSALAVDAILAAATTILVPVADRLARFSPPLETPKSASYCPHCGAVLRTLTRDGLCQACGVRFRVDFRGISRPD